MQQPIDDWEAVSARGGIYARAKQDRRSGKLEEITLLVFIEQAKEYGNWNLIQILFEVFKTYGIKEVKEGEFQDSNGLIHFKYTQDSAGVKYVYITVKAGQLNADMVLPMLQDTLVRQGLLDDDELFKPIASAETEQVKEPIPVQRPPSDFNGPRRFRYPTRECPRCETDTADPFCVCGHKFGID